MAFLIESVVGEIATDAILEPLMGGETLTRLSPRFKEAGLSAGYLDLAGATLDETDVDTLAMRGEKITSNIPKTKKRHPLRPFKNGLGRKIVPAAAGVSMLMNIGINTKQNKEMSSIESQIALLMEMNNNKL